MTTEVKTQCPAHGNSTGGSDSYSFNEDKGQGYCFSCGLSTWLFKEELWGKYEGEESFKIDEQEEEPTVTKDDQDDWADVVEPIKTTKGTSEGVYEGIRGITKATMQKYGVKKFGPEYHFVYPAGGKKFRNMDLPKSDKGHFGASGKMNDLFGANQFPKGCSKVLTVVEGEFDALAAYQMINDTKWLNPVVSVPSATPSAAFWETNKEYFESFQQIKLSLDNDEAGKKLIDKFIKIYPEKCFIMDHGIFKDANDFLINGEGRAYKEAWWNARQYVPDDILVSPEDFLKMYDESPELEYFTTGIPQLDEKLGGGISKGYLTLIQAPTGIGKTALLRMIEYNCFANSKFKFATKHLEETHKESILGLVSYDLQDRLLDKAEIEQKGKTQEVRESIQKLTKDGRIVFYDLDPAQGNDEIIKKFRYLINAMEVDYIFLEPIQDAVAGGSASDKEGRISDLVSRMGGLCGETGVGFVIIAHENSEGGAMYSSMITKKAGFKIVLSGDRESEDLTERNKTYIKVVDKNRSGKGFGNAGVVTFDLDTYTLKPDIKSEPMVNTKDDF